MRAAVRDRSGQREHGQGVGTLDDCPWWGAGEGGELDADGGLEADEALGVVCERLVDFAEAGLHLGAQFSALGVDARRQRIDAPALGVDTCAQVVDAVSQRVELLLPPR